MKTLLAFTAALAVLVGCATQSAESKSYAMVLTTKADIADAGTSVVIPGFGSQQDCEAAMTAKSTEAMAQRKNTGVVSARCGLIKS